MLFDILQFAIGLSVLVLIHEFGHFITAKLSGIKVEEFGFGFPPRVFGVRRGETLYSINLLPIGGFVKLYGEDDAGGGKLGKVEQKEHNSHHFKDINRAFFARPAWQRATIVLAGVIMNFILAVVVITYLFSTQGVGIPIGHVRITDVVQNSPAQNAGLLRGDKVVKFNDIEIKDADTFQSETRKHLGKDIQLTIERNNESLIITLRPRSEVPKGQGPIGVGITDIQVKKFAWYEAPFYGTWEAFKFSALIIKGLGDVILDAFQGQKPQGVAGPVGVYQLSSKVAEYGINSWLWFMALLSLNLAVMNVLPIPALDGGRLFFIIIEMVTRKKVNPKYESYAHAVGLILLLTFLALITFNDVLRLIQGKSLLP